MFYCAEIPSVVLDSFGYSLQRYGEKILDLNINIIYTICLRVFRVCFCILGL